MQKRIFDVKSEVIHRREREVCVGGRVLKKERVISNTSNVGGSNSSSKKKKN